MSTSSQSLNEPSGQAERRKVLDMLANSKINSTQAADLLAALNTGSRSTSGPQSDPAPAGTNRWLRVKITDTYSGRPKTTVNVPVGIVDWGLRIGACFTPELEGVDLNELRSIFSSGIEGKIIDVLDEVDGDHIEVFIE